MRKYLRFQIQIIFKNCILVFLNHHQCESFTIDSGKTQVIFCVIASAFADYIWKNAFEHIKFFWIKKCSWETKPANRSNLDLDKSMYRMLCRNKAKMKSGISNVKFLRKLFFLHHIWETTPDEKKTSRNIIDCQGQLWIRYYKQNQRPLNAE